MMCPLLYRHTGHSWPLELPLVLVKLVSLPLLQQSWGICTPMKDVRLCWLCFTLLYPWEGWFLYPFLFKCCCNLRFLCCSGLGYIVGSGVGAAFGDWRWGLRVTPILNVIAVLFMIFFMQDPERGRKTEPNVVRTALKIIKSCLFKVRPIPIIHIWLATVSRTTFKTWCISLTIALSF